MTIAVSVKVNDGIVLAADSAVTLTALDADGRPYIYAVYNNAIKVFNLRKGLPIGAMIWGMAGIGNESIGTLLKDLRRRFTGEAGWIIDQSSYTIESVAGRVCDFIHGERLAAWRQALEDGVTVNTSMGILVGGYSTGAEHAETWVIRVEADGTCAGPVLISPNTEPVAMFWDGQPEAIYRLFFGLGSAMPAVLENNLGIPSDQIAPAIDIMKNAMQARIITPAMPIQDAIELADFLADTCAKFSRFEPGFATVGGTIEIAAITKHEGFKWVRRKLYYDRAQNPEDTR